MRFANSQQLLPNRRWHPRIDSVGNDVIELTSVGRKTQNVAGGERDIPQPNFSDQFLPPLYRGWRKIQPDKLALRQLVTCGDEVGAVAAAQFQHPAMLGGRRLHSKQGSDYRKTAGMRLRIDKTCVGDLLVPAKNG